MARNLQYIFPAANTQDVCKTQTTTGAAQLILNGNLSAIILPGVHSVPFVQNGYSRQISISSTNNLSASSFTVSGNQNGVLITEVITGPNNNTVNSTQFYDEVTSISVDGAVTAVSIGTGPSGYFKLIELNLVSTINNYINYSLSLSSGSSTNVIGTTIYSTLQEIYNNGVTFKNATTAPNINIFTTVKAAGNEASYFLQSQTMVKYFLIVLSGTALTASNSITINFIQV